jgi:hypothetical protein
MFTTLPAVNAPVGGAPTAFPKNVTASEVALQLGLEDLLGELQFARRTDDLGRLAFLAFCEALGWARVAGERELAQQSSELFNHFPHASREAFMGEVDELIVELKQTHLRIAGAFRTADGV